MNDDPTRRHDRPSPSEAPTRAAARPTVEVTPVGEAGVLHQGRRVAVGPAGLVLGRATRSGLDLDSPRASREHARIEGGPTGFRLVDLGSKNGTQLNGREIDAPAALRSGDQITIGGTTVTFVHGPGTQVAPSHLPLVATRTVSLASDHVTIGRDAANDLVLDDPNVSRFHAELRTTEGRRELVDLGSTNGTWADGRLVETAVVDPGSEVRIGPYRLILESTSLVAHDERGHLQLRADAVALRIGDKQVLSPTSITLTPGSFVAVIGESGAGKSTLLKALADVQRPSSGRVTVNGDPIEVHRTSLGYVPQSEIVHDLLTVAEALRFSAQLRLPEDTSAEEVATACGQVLEELELSEHADTQVRRLSGGQRRRVGVALELLSRPGLLFLDEPTTGLDPGLEAKLMGVLRDLADPTRAVVIVTHATASLGLCDDVIVMGAGGHLCFRGTPAAALAFFEVGSYDAIYTALTERPALEWKRRYADRNAREPAEAAEPAAAPLSPPPPRRRGRQITILARRYALTTVRDRRNLLILLGQVPLMAVAIAVLFSKDTFGLDPRPENAAQLLFLMVTVVIWIGAIDAAREIVKERSVFLRETAVGVRLDAYLLSKLCVLSALAAVQVGLLTAIVLALRPIDGSPADAVLLLVILLLTALSALAMGLAVSAAATSQDQATSFVPLVLVPQLFFAGAIIPVAKMTPAIEAVSHVVFARWAYAASGVPVDLDAKLDRGRPSVYGSFFDVAAPVHLAILAAFAAALLGLTYLLLRRRARSAY